MELRVKRNGSVVLLVQATSAQGIKDLKEKICSLYNGIQRLKRMADASADILEHGLLKPEKDHGYSIEEIEIFSTHQVDPKKGVRIERDGKSYSRNRDPTGRRLGEAPDPNGADARAIAMAIQHARVVTGASYIENGRFLTEEELGEAMKMLGDALIAAYPAGLPEWETAREIMEGCENLAGSAASKEVFSGGDDTALWWAGKELASDKTLADYLGKNEKTKTLVTLAKKELGAPCKEPPLSAGMRKELTEFYNKKDEDLKASSQAEEDFENSVWASSKRRGQAPRVLRF
ncbi:hypothetical protein HK101_003187 [Irineochytrium annulatum]|nr:hypothetical protein HK101_003187 [Irineochytrium annulatum]